MMRDDDDDGEGVVIIDIGNDDFVDGLDNGCDGAYSWYCVLLESSAVAAVVMSTKLVARSRRWFDAVASAAAELWLAAILACCSSAASLSALPNDWKDSNA